MPKKIDLTGQVFGRLRVIGEEYPRKTKSLRWLCQCECGNYKAVRGYDLKSGKTQSCGCLRNERVREAVGNNLIGQRFGRLIVLEQADSIREPSGMLRTAWLCQCDCGKRTIVKTLNLKAGDTKSCGCLNLDNLKSNYKDLTNIRFGKLVAIERDEDTILNREESDKRIYWKCKCDCGNIKTVSSNNLIQGHTTSCGCIHSQGENLIEQALQEMNINYSKEFSFNNLKGDNGLLRFDFAIFEDKTLLFLIEYQGEQHYNPIEFFGGEQQLEKQQRYDKLKQDFCKKEKIPLVIISYWDKTKINLEYIKEKINEVLRN